MVRTEQKSGTSLEDRTELKTILDFIHEGENSLELIGKQMAQAKSEIIYPEMLKYAWVKDRESSIENLLMWFTSSLPVSASRCTQSCDTNHVKTAG